MSLLELVYGQRVCQAGCWFVLREKNVIFLETGRPFAPAKVEFGGRRVVLREEVFLNETPNVIVYARSTSADDRWHSKHSSEHVEDHFCCALDVDAAVVPFECVVTEDQFNRKSWSCEEPPDSEFFTKFLPSVRSDSGDRWKFSL